MKPELSDHERAEILNSKPVGTWALLLMVGGGMLIAWLLIYFGIFVPRGLVH